jgi:hypothetical protein
LVAKPGEGLGKHQCGSFGIVEVRHVTAKLQLQKPLR